MANLVTFIGDEQNTGSSREYNGKQYPKGKTVLEENDKIASKLACLGCFKVSDGDPPASTAPAPDSAAQQENPQPQGSNEPSRAELLRMAKELGLPYDATATRQQLQEMVDAATAPA